MDVRWHPDLPKLTPGEWFFPPALLKTHAKELPEYYQYQLFKLQRVVAGRKDSTDALILDALAELRSLCKRPELKWLTEEKYDFC